jgi:2-dehydro-3-deoxyphosphogluconate aldolase/(4S)-4-hydroxy-2-oxoglutarate aldolase
MTAQSDLAQIVDGGVIAIVRLDSAARLIDAANAIAKGGITTIEFTMTTPGAIDALSEACSTIGGHVVLGAGTVLDTETARAAILAGARFIVSPTFSKDVVAMCRRYGVVSMPGAYSPTEVLTAWESGADLVKVFPAGGLGPSYVRDILAPMPHVRLVPTGGVTLDNAAAFIQAGATAVAVGGNLVEPKAVAAGDMERITRLAGAFQAAVESARHRPA